MQISTEVVIYDRNIVSYILFSKCQYTVDLMAVLLQLRMVMQVLEEDCIVTDIRS